MLVRPPGVSNERLAELAQDQLDVLWSQLTQFMDKTFAVHTSESQSDISISYVGFLELYTLQYNFFRTSPGKNPITMLRFYERLENYLAAMAMKVLSEGRSKTEIQIELISRVLSNHQRNLRDLNGAQPTIVVRGDEPDAAKKMQAPRDRSREPKKTVIEMWDEA